MSNTKSVQVALRVRPLVASEINKGCKEILEIYPDFSQVKIANSDRAFTYNHVFGPFTTQTDFYNKAVKEMIANLFKGYNMTILAYGQTGSGKTHSMGTTYSGEGEMGVIPRVIRDIFDFIKDNFSYDFTITVSFMELYQEVLYDLLSDKQREQCILDIREDPSKGIMIPGLTEVEVGTAHDVFNNLTKGSQGRATGATNMNAQSSRSHAIFTINISMQNKENCQENKTAKFHLVDLAGSERQKKTGAIGTTLREGININKGLLVLGNVISALGDDKQQHIPYRDSNLTRLLKDSLGGNSITLMIACVSPADYNLDETLSTLRYADRARKIQNKPIINQDPKLTEINELKKIIQHLRLQLLSNGNNGGILCPAELELLKKDNSDLRTKICNLTIQLSSALNVNTGLLEKIIILQNSNEELTKRINSIKDEYNLTINNISNGFQDNNTELIKENLNKLELMKNQFLDIENEQRKTESEIQKHDETYDIDNNNGVHAENEINEKHQSHTNRQLALNLELQEITKQLTMKEHLARQIATNNEYMVDYKSLAENELKIAQLQKEKDQLKHQLKTVQSNSKLSEQQRKRVQELEKELQDLNRKVQEQARLIKLKEKDELKIRKLNTDILQMKQTKVKLIKSMREEADKFRTWKQQRERELAKLKQEDRKKQNKIVKMEVMHSKQQCVLKRKVEEAVALNKRLKDALALRKQTQDNKQQQMNKNDRLHTWIKQEFNLFLNVIEAESTLQSLMEDRAMLNQQLNELKQQSNPDLNEIKTIEDDIELRSVQIQDLQQKLLDSDEDSKLKMARFDNIQTMNEAKYLLKFLKEQCGDLKKQQISSDTKIIELQSIESDLHEKLQSVKNKAKLTEMKFTEDIANLQKDNEEKISVLLRQLRGIEVNCIDDELKQRCLIQQQKMDEQEKIIEEKMQEIEKLKKNMKAIQNAVQEHRTPDMKQHSSSRKHLNVDGNAGCEIVNLDSSIEFEDNPDKDPDWRKTPIGKWLVKSRRNYQQNETFKIDGTIKRNSDGGCMCTKNCSNRCGCRKVSKFCSTSCKCTADLCTNKTDSEDDSKSEDNYKSFKKPLTENNDLLKSKRSKHSYLNTN